MKYKDYYPDKLDPKIKVFNTTISATKKKDIRKYSYRIKVDYLSQKIILLVTSRYYNYKITQMSWSFNELKLRIESKLKYMVLVPLIRDRRFDKIYFKYLMPEFYEFRSFDDFLKLVETGDICITFKISYHHDKEKYGQILDRGTSFDLNFDSLEKLFKKIDVEVK